MSALIDGIALAGTADDGDVPSDSIGIGFSEDALELAAADEELAELEAIAGAMSADGGGPAADPAGADDLPDEGPAPAATDDATAPDPDATGTVAAGVLVDQPTAAPSRKVKAAGLGGTLGAIPAPILSLLDLLPVSDAVLGAISAALTLLGSLAAAYLARERAVDPASASTG